MPNPENPYNFFDPEIDSELSFLENLSLGEQVKWAQTRNRHVIIEGDWGGEILATIPAKEIKCSEETLYELAADLNQEAWNEDPTGTEGMCLYISSVDEEMRASVIGGMGGGELKPYIWVSSSFEADPSGKGIYRSKEIQLVISGKAKNLAEARVLYQKYFDQELKKFSKKIDPPRSK